MKEFWMYSIQCGIAARTLAQYSMTMPVNLYFSLGLLHEIGHAAMFARHPELSLQVLDEHQQPNTSLRELEQQTFGFDYAQIGAEIMKIWQLPELYQQAAAFHENPDQVQDAHRHTLNIMHLAHAFCQNPVAGKHQALLEEFIAKDPKLKRLPNNIDELIIKEIETHADSIIDALWPLNG